MIQQESRWVMPFLTSAWMKRFQTALLQIQGERKGVGAVSEKTSLLAEQTESAHVSSPLFSMAKTVLEDFQTYVSQGLHLLSKVLQMLCLKAFVMVLACPLFCLALLAGWVEGLHQRAVRKASLGRESTYLFHRTFIWLGKTVTTVLLLWLALPLAIDPSWVCLGLSVFLGVMVSQHVRRFKKYL